VLAAGCEHGEVIDRQKGNDLLAGCLFDCIKLDTSYFVTSCFLH